MNFQTSPSQFGKPIHTFNFLSEVTTNEINKITQSLKNGTAGHEDITAAKLKLVAGSGNQPLAYLCNLSFHDDVIKWKHFSRYWPFVQGIQRLTVNSPHKGRWRGALMFSLICAWINGWVNNREAGDLRRNRARYDVIAMHSMCFREITQISLCSTIIQSGRPL